MIGLDDLVMLRKYLRIICKNHNRLVVIIFLSFLSFLYMRFFLHFCFLSLVHIFFYRLAFCRFFDILFVAFYIFLIFYTAFDIPFSSVLHHVVFVLISNDPNFYNKTDCKTFAGGEICLENTHYGISGKSLSKYLPIILK